MASPPSSFVSALLSLLSATRLPSSSTLNTLPFPHPGPPLCSYVQAVLHPLQPILATFPSAIVQLLPQITHPDSSSPIPNTTSNTTSPTSPLLPFPAGSFVPSYPRPLRAESNPDPNSDAPVTRLRGNLEITVDALLVLHRKYRGDISSARLGVLDQMDAMRAMAALHPANVDFFAARLLSFIHKCALAPDRSRRLHERLHTSAKRAKPATASTARAGSQQSVVLHRVPPVVRDSFMGEHPAHLFFLDLLTTVDSARLNSALAPRIAAAISQAIATAAAATSAAAFTAAVLDARLFAKLLSVIMHLPNWPHSPSSFSGPSHSTPSPAHPASTSASAIDPAPSTSATAAAVTDGTGLSAAAQALRMPVLSSTWSALFDVEVLVCDAVASAEICAVVASTAVADVMVRFAAVDPVARMTDWFRRAVSATAKVAVVNEDGSVFPPMRVLIGELLATPGVVSDTGIFWSGHLPPVLCDMHVAHSIADARFLRFVCPVLEDMRREFAALVDGVVASRVKTRRITPLPTIIKKEDGNGNWENELSHELGNTGISEVDSDDDGGSMQSALRREFFSRIDGRIRELVGVVATACPDNSDNARDALLKVVGLLYPETPQTVAAVAAEVCAKRVTAVRRGQLYHEYGPMKELLPNKTAAVLED